MRLYKKLKRKIKHFSNTFFPAYVDDLGTEMPCHWLVKVHEIEVSFVISLTGSDIDHIMELALRGGIAYWCKRVEVATSWSDRPAYEQISRCGSLRFYDVDGRTHELTLEKFLSGFRLFYIKNGEIGKDPTGRMDVRDIGRTEADAIIQYALYGEFYFD